MKKSKKIVIGTFIIIFIGIAINEITRSPFERPQKNFDSSFVKEIELVVDGQTFTFLDKSDLDYIKSFIEGKTYYDVEYPGKCVDEYHIDSLKLIGDSERNSLFLIPTGDDCGFWGPYGLFNSDRFSLGGGDLYPLMEFFELKTNMKIIDEHLKEHMKEKKLEEQLKQKTTPNE